MGVNSASIDVYKASPVRRKFSRLGWLGCLRATPMWFYTWRVFWFGIPQLRSITNICWQSYSKSMSIVWCLTERNVRSIPNGHWLENGQIQADLAKMETITKMEPPTSKCELQSFLGSINFFAYHIPDHSTILGPLYYLFKNNCEFIWKLAEWKAFEKLKKIISNAPVLAFYDPKKSTVVSCDAFLYRIGAVLLQKADNVNLLPVTFASHSISKVEKYYAQIKKEVLAIVWAWSWFDNFLIGLQFIIETYHKPLLLIRIIKFLDELSPQLQLFRMKLQWFNYEVIYITGKNLVTADLFLRNMVSSTTDADRKFEFELQTIAFQKVNSINCSQSMHERIKADQHEVDIRKKLIQFIKVGWPVQRNEAPNEIIWTGYIKDLCLLKMSLCFSNDICGLHHCFEVKCWKSSMKVTLA